MQHDPRPELLKKIRHLGISYRSIADCAAENLGFPINRQTAFLVLQGKGYPDPRKTPKSDAIMTATENLISEAA